jgi:Asp-tRNA(Asn)/Glu-tRNA(Gln) amidotransferase A subunit family amidase
LKPIDWAPFDKAGRLLYDGTFVSERLASLPDDFLEKNRVNLHPVILKLFEAVVARNSTAVQAYRDIQAKAQYTRDAENVFGYSGEGVDVVIVPTAPTHWKTEQVLADPIKKNSILGVSYTLQCVEYLLTWDRSLRTLAISWIFAALRSLLGRTRYQSFLEMKVTPASSHFQ